MVRRKLHTFRLTAALLAAISLAPVVLGGPMSALAQVPAPGATAEVRDANNRVVASAEFREGRGEVLITLVFPNPPVLSGTHAIHITDAGRCDPPDFASSGNIFNPFNKKHGRQNPEGSEVGDLPNVNFSNGLTSYNTTATGATLGSGQASLLSPGRALVIFSGEDDQKTDPDGNAGSRIACGVITAAAGAAAAPAGAAAPAAAAARPTSPPTPAPAAANQPRIASPVPAQAAQAGQVGQAAQPGQVGQPGQALQQVQPAQGGQPGQPAQAGQPAAGQPVAGQPVAGQPVAQPKPANTPIVVGKPAVVSGAASPSPVVVAGGAAAVPTPIVAAAVPTPISVAAAPTPQTSGGLSNVNALLIAILGVGLVGIGWFLRQRRQLR